jgi:hypothetical protein
MNDPLPPCLFFVIRILESMSSTSRVVNNAVHVEAEGLSRWSVPISMHIFVKAANYLATLQPLMSAMLLPRTSLVLVSVAMSVLIVVYIVM